ncbi:sulfatase family protein [Nocardioides sp. J54]|uniref:sulfatase family protein n=1 Tax=Nocardioides sp. J54 TaxID=935866 RepID=UPI00048ACBA4|nr:sulfatase [Nocardioides sp. J54]
MVRSKTRLLAVLVALVVALALASGITAPAEDVGASAATPDPAATDPAARAAASGLNVVVVMADDMRVDDLAYAPNLRRLVARRGLTYENSFSPYPLCCPARASFLTGRYAHNHRVYHHDKPWGYQSFDDSRTLATSLRAAGYRTGFIGKYLNGYGRDRSRVSGQQSARYVPRGWHDWRAAIENDGSGRYSGGTYGYFNTAFNMNGRIVDSYRGRYQSDVIGDLSVGMARRFAARPSPFFMYVNYVAPHHGAPWEPDDPRGVRGTTGKRIKVKTPARPQWVKGRFDKRIRRAAGLARTGNAVERDLSDKPRSVRRARMHAGSQAYRAYLEATRQRAEAVFVMDRNIARLVAELKRSGEWARTVFVFTSDNGLIIGEHDLGLTKIWAHEPSLRVPLLVTGPGMRSGQRRYDPVSTMDLTATILDVAGAEPPRTPDGTSRWPAMRGGDQGWSTPIVTEAISTARGSHPLFTDRRSSIGIRTSRYSYTRYRDGGGELYDLLRDPRQDRNVYRSAAYADVRAQLAGVWTQVKSCRGETCRTPLPDGLAATPGQNRATTAAYWKAIRAAYG